MAALPIASAGVQGRACLEGRALSQNRVRISARATASPAAQKKGSQLTQEVIDDEAKYILHTYGRTPIVLTHGSGATVHDIEGREYVDFTSGIAVNALGHGDPRWVETVAEQASLLAHTSNLFHTLPQVQLAKTLVENSFADKAFFANSGHRGQRGRHQVCPQVCQASR
ncbi:hypothetical protein QBZ16_000613 [Prototheca wickerhamii]|uniref:Acetylornithine transaminase n=1 Tax=Prototheca wickerhamii TaxID=3111 RepID=A0AAD9MIW7_PROWI|nr:hypothetical protein QBZ16_000613 [Prototheca wickerhamii]